MEVTQEQMKSILDRLDKAEKFKTLYEEEKKKNEEASQSGFSHIIAGNRAGSLESQAMGIFGGDLKSLLEVNTEDPLYSHVDPAVKQQVKNLKRDLTTARMIAQLYHGEQTDQGEHPSYVKGMLDTPFGKDVLKYRIEAFGSDTTNAGKEWIPTAMAATYIEESPDLALTLFGLVNQTPMHTAKMDIPVKGKSKAIRASENSRAPNKSFSTRNIELSSVKFTDGMQLPEELTEDTAPNILAMAQNEVKLAHVRSYESCTINGQAFDEESGKPHMDKKTADEGAEAAEYNWHGLRYYALKNATGGSIVDGGGQKVSDLLLRQMFSRIRTTNPGELVWVVSKMFYHGMMATKNVTTVDVFGLDATTKKGTLPAYMGIPIIVTDYMYQDLAATGMNTGDTEQDLFTGGLLVDRKRWYAGRRRPIKSFVRYNQEYDRNEIVAWSRVAFNGLRQTEDNIDVVYAINVKTL
ncbi:MAG: hypothetical protein MJK13_07365 [Pseudomonadales bacterium]|nr:hypothetical protein [Pseudomonadales bacterium]